MTEDYRLKTDLRVCLVTVLAGKHIDLALVKPELRDVSLEEEYVAALIIK